MNVNYLHFPIHHLYHIKSRCFNVGQLIGLLVYVPLHVAEHLAPSFSLQLVWFTSFFGLWYAAPFHTVLIIGYYEDSCVLGWVKDTCFISSNSCSPFFFIVVYALRILPPRITFLFIIHTYIYVFLRPRYVFCFVS